MAVSRINHRINYSEAWEQSDIDDGTAPPCYQSDELDSQSLINYAIQNKTHLPDNTALLDNPDVIHVESWNTFHGWLGHNENASTG